MTQRQLSVCGPLTVPDVIAVPLATFWHHSPAVLSFTRSGTRSATRAFTPSVASV